MTYLIKKQRIPCQKSHTFCQKSPTFCQISPRFFENTPVFCQTRPTCYQSWPAKWKEPCMLLCAPQEPCILFKEACILFKEACILPKEAYIPSYLANNVERALHFVLSSARGLLSFQRGLGSIKSGACTHTHTHTYEHIHMYNICTFTQTTHVYSHIHKKKKAAWIWAQSMLWVTRQYSPLERRWKALKVARRDNSCPLPSSTSILNAALIRECVYIYICTVSNIGTCILLCASIYMHVFIWQEAGLFWQKVVSHYCGFCKLRNAPALLAESGLF